VKIVRSIKGKEEFSVLAHKAMIAETQARLRDHQRVQDQRKLEETLEPMDDRKRRMSPQNSMISLPSYDFTTDF